MSVTPSATAADGFVVHSHAGDDWRVCRDYVRAALGLKRVPLARAKSEPARIESDNNWKKALAIWCKAGNPVGSPVETYLRGRGLDLPPDAIRFASRLWFRGQTFDAMVCLVRGIASNEPQGVHITELVDPAAGQRGDRFCYGPVGGGCIKLDHDEDVTMVLAVAEGIETALAGRRLGFRPVWAAVSAGGVAAFPVLGGVEALTIFGETDGANARAVERCRARWAEAGREVTVNHPLIGSDLNDVSGRTAS